MTERMSAPSPKFVRCPGCGQRLGIRDQDAGRRARCTQCGEMFTVGAAEAAAPPPAKAPVAMAPPPPEFVSFECSLCQTRMSARVVDVGRTMACPDCGRKNVVPPPPKRKAPVVPAAMLGEQYELMATNEPPGEFPKAAPLVPVECRLCQTLMYAAADKVGGEIKCPDCGAKTVVRAPRPVKPSGPLLARAGEEYQLDPASAPTERPVPMPVAMRDAQLHEHARATTVGPDGRLIVQKQERRPRPVRPAMPLIQGVWRMLVTEEVIVRWIMSSILFGAAGWLIIDSLNTPVQSVAAIAGIFLMLMGVGMTVMWLTFAAPTFLAVVVESAEGHDRLHEPPGWSPFEWLGEMMYLVTALAVAGMPGMLAWTLGALLPPAVVGGVAGGVALMIFPLAFLGALLENTPLGVVSPRLLATIPRRPGPWLLFYAEVALLAAAAAAACYGLFRAGPPAAYAIPLVIMGATFVLMRLLGRLGWWLSDLVAIAEDDDDDEDVDDAEAAHPHLAAARRAAREEARQAK